MTKELQIMNFLHERVFNPILYSPDAPPQTKQGVLRTIERMSKMNAREMWEYYGR